MSQYNKLEVLLRSLLWDAELPAQGEFAAISDLEILRTKGLFSVMEEDNNKDTYTAYIVQGVKELYEIKNLPKSLRSSEDSGTGRLVLIGKGLREVLRESLLHSLNAA